MAQVHRRLRSRRLSLDMEWDPKQVVVGKEELFGVFPTDRLSTFLQIHEVVVYIDATPSLTVRWLGALQCFLSPGLYCADGV